MRLTLVLAILAIVLTVGCKKTDATHAGTYIGHIEVSDKTLDLIAGTPSMAGKSRDQLKTEIAGQNWVLRLDSNGTYVADSDKGTWRLDEGTGVVHMTIPVSYKQGAIDNFNKNPLAKARFGDKYMVNVTELRLRTNEPGKLGFDTNDHLVDSGIDLTSLGIDPDLGNLRFVFVKQ